MTTYYIVASNAGGAQAAGNVNGYPQITAGGAINAQPGDVFIVDGGVNTNITINAAAAVPTPVTVQFGQNLTALATPNSAAVTFGLDTLPTVNIAAGVDADGLQFDAARSDGITVNAADGAKVGLIIGSPDTDTVTAGNGVTFNGLWLNDSTVANLTIGHDAVFNYVMTLDAADSTITMTVGDRAVFNVSASLTATTSDRSLTLGNDATIHGSLTMTGQGTPGNVGDVRLVAGNNLHIDGALSMDGAYLNQSFTAGTNAYVQSLTMTVGNGTATVDMGDGAQIYTSITLGGQLSTTSLVLGDGTTVGSSGGGSLTASGSDSQYNLLLGDNVTVNGALTMTGSLNTQWIKAGDFLRVNGEMNLGGQVLTNGVEIGDNFWLLGNLVTASNSDAVTEYIKIGDEWRIGGQLNVAGGKDELFLGRPVAGQVAVVTGDGITNDGVAVFAPQGQEAAFQTAAFAKGWVQNADGSFSPTKTGQDLIFGNIMFFNFDRSADPTAAPDWSSQTIFRTPDGIVDGTAGADVFGPGDTDADGDAVDGADGNDDRIATGDGADTVAAGLGNDTVDGGAGADNLAGGDGNDSLDGAAGDDALAGDAGNDTLAGGAGNDTLAGGAGDDLFLLAAGFGNDSLLGGETGETTGDTLDGSGLSEALTLTLATPESGTLSGASGTVTFAGIEQVLLGTGSDTVTGSTGGDSVDGGLGNDVLAGGDGDDTLLGGAGNDALDGGTGADSLGGGDGADTLMGGAANDLLDGGADADDLDGGDGNDTLTGGIGADTLTGGAGADRFVVDATPDLITDFDTVTGIGNPSRSDNDFVDLSAYYNDISLAAWNAANPAQTFTNPLAWLKSDQADGKLDQAGGLRLTFNGVPVDAAGLSVENTSVICFARGTLILTEHGPVPVEELTLGQRLQTVDNGCKPLLWIGSSKVAADGPLAPIRIAAGVLRNDTPLFVSPQHRLRIRTPLTGRRTQREEALVAAKHLLGTPGITRETGETVEYFHFLLDRHELVFSNGAVTESLFTGPEALKSVTPAALEEIATLFPELVRSGGLAPAPVRAFLRGKEGRRLAEHHARNRKVLMG